MFLGGDGAIRSGQDAVVDLLLALFGAVELDTGEEAIDNILSIILPWPLGIYGLEDALWDLRERCKSRSNSRSQSSDQLDQGDSPWSNISDMHDAY